MSEHRFQDITDPRVLASLGKSGDPQLQILVAQNPATSARTLFWDLSIATHAVVRRLAKKHPNWGYYIPQESLITPEKLEPVVPDALFLNLTSDLRDSIVSGGDLLGKMLIAKRADTPLKILVNLLEDPHEGVRMTVAANPKMLPDILKCLSLDDNAGIRAGVAGNPNTPSGILDLLSRDTNFCVRRAVAANLATSTGTLNLLQLDEDERVRPQG